MGYLNPHTHNLDGLLDAPVGFWQCPVEGHRHRTDRDGHPVPTVEWDGDVATCLWRGCWRRSDDPNPRRECMCEGYRDGSDAECTGECCGPGQCSCTPSDGEDQ